LNRDRRPQVAWVGVDGSAATQPSKNERFYLSMLDNMACWAAVTKTVDVYVK